MKTASQVSETKVLNYLRSCTELCTTHNKEEINYKHSS